MFLWASRQVPLKIGMALQQQAEKEKVFIQITHEKA